MDRRGLGCRLLVWVAATLSLGGGCGGSTPDDLPDHDLRDAGSPNDADSASPRVDATLDAGDATMDGAVGPSFRACDGVFRSVPGLECIETTVPRLWHEPEGETVVLTIERVPARLEPRSQLWLLAGGPGGSSFTFEHRAARFQEGLPYTELLMVDHRGVGLTDRLSCPTAEAPDSPGGTHVTDGEWPDCIASIMARHAPSSLAAYSTTTAARDLAVAIELARRPDTPVYVYGSSYGTYWAQRWLQLFPEQADAVVLDSICSPGTCTQPVGSAVEAEEVGRAVFDACAGNSACVERFGPEPYARALRALESVDAGSCPRLADAGLDSADLRALANALLRDARTRTAVVAMFLRVERCAEADETAFATLASLLHTETVGREEDRLEFSVPLYALVVRSELWDEPTPSLADYHTLLSGSVFAPPLRHYAVWRDGPRYEPDEWVGGYPTTSIPVLMLNGSMDPQTPVSTARLLGEHLDGAYQHFVIVDRATHGVVNTSCGMSLLWHFLADPGAELDTTCRTWLPELDFEDESVAPMLFGTTSLYGEEASLAIVGAAALEERETLRRQLRAWP